jgi:hypothetical protein
LINQISEFTCHDTSRRIHDNIFEIDSIRRNDGGTLLLAPMLYCVISLESSNNGGMAADNAARCITDQEVG